MYDRVRALYAVLAFTLQCRAAIVARDMHVVNKDVSPDGFTRSSVVADGVLPGPLIQANIGDNLKINVIDELTDDKMNRATSIHWHGFFQRGSNLMDGPSFVNQCPIVPGHSYTYDFSVPDQAGTFWYHSHLATQYCDGLRGPIVIYDPNDPHKALYDVDDSSTVITLSDWYHDFSPALFGKQKNIPVQTSNLINGLGRYPGGPASPLTVVNVQQGKRYRFRVVSMSCLPYYQFSIDGHGLTIIETDGVETVPHSVDMLEIYAGQRYSLVLNANQTVGNYWIRAKPNLGDTTFTGGLNSAILRYAGAPNAEPTSTIHVSPVVMNEAHLSPLLNPGAPGVPRPGAADVNLYFPISVDPVTHAFNMGGHSFESPSVPVLLQVLSGAAEPTSLLPSGSVISLPPNKVVEISFPRGFNHPFHLHGHTFDVIRTAGTDQYNFKNPVRRDVVSIGKELTDNVTFRFVTDNPGPWFLHCHIDWHLEAGLAVVFAEDSETVRAQGASVTGDAAWSELCPLFNQNNPDTHLPF